MIKFETSEQRKNFVLFQIFCSIAVSGKVGAPKVLRVPRRFFEIFIKLLEFSDLHNHDQEKKGHENSSRSAAEENIFFGVPGPEKVCPSLLYRILKTAQVLIIVSISNAKHCEFSERFTFLTQ